MTGIYFRDKFIAEVCRDIINGKTLVCGEKLYNEIYGCISPSKAILLSDKSADKGNIIYAKSIDEIIHRLGNFPVLLMGACPDDNIIAAGDIVKELINSCGRVCYFTDGSIMEMSGFMKSIGAEWEPVLSSCGKAVIGTRKLNTAELRRTGNGNLKLRGRLKFLIERFGLTERAFSEARKRIDLFIKNNPDEALKAGFIASGSVKLSLNSCSYVINGAKNNEYIVISIEIGIGSSYDGEYCLSFAADTGTPLFDTFEISGKEQERDKREFSSECKPDEIIHRELSETIERYEKTDPRLVYNCAAENIESFIKDEPDEAEKYGFTSAEAIGFPYRYTKYAVYNFREGNDEYDRIIMTLDMYADDKYIGYYSLVLTSDNGVILDDIFWGV